LAAIIIRSTRRVRVVLEQMMVWHFAFRRRVTHFWASSCEAKSFLSESRRQSRFVWGRCDYYYCESAINNNKNEKLLFKHK
jgi:hypothetical protein